MLSHRNEGWEHMAEEQKNGTLPATGERFIPNMFRDIRLSVDHYLRYYNALKYVENKTVLDIASGEGYGTSILAGKADFVYGVDISSEAVEHAKARYQAANLKFIQGSAADIPLDDASVDMIVSYETIEHLPEDLQERMLQEFKRILKPDGILLISTPDKYDYTDIPQEENHFHIHELYREEFFELLSKYFKHFKIGEQKCLSGGILYWPHSSMETYQFQQEEKTDGVLRPLYLLAMASDGNIPETTSSFMEADLNSYATVQEVVELFYAEQAYGFSEMNKNVQILVGDQCIQPEIRFPLNSGMGRFFRIDCGAPNKKYTIHALHLLSGKGEILADLRNGITAVDALLNPFAGDPSAFDFIPYSNDPQILFRIPDGIDLADAVLKMDFSVEPFDTLPFLAEMNHGSNPDLDEELKRYQTTRKDARQIAEKLRKELTEVKNTAQKAEYLAEKLRKELTEVKNEDQKVRQTSEERRQRIQILDDECIAKQAQIIGLEKKEQRIRKNCASFQSLIVKQYEENIVSLDSLLQEKEARHLCLETLRCLHTPIYQSPDSLKNRIREKLFGPSGKLTFFETLEQKFQNKPPESFWKALIVSTAYFNPEWYLNVYPDVAGIMDPLDHYLYHGWKEGRDPSPYFSTSFYLENNPDVRETGMQPLVHYLSSGIVEGRKPMREKQTPIPETPDHALVRMSPFFDADYYVSQVPDPEAAKADPAAHYLSRGWELGYPASKAFDTGFYVYFNRDLNPANQNPLLHYILNGVYEGRKCTPDPDLVFGTRQNQSGQELIFVSHHADKTGAPLLSLNLCRKFYQLGYSLHIVLLHGGPLVKEFEKYGVCYLLESPGSILALAEKCSGTCHQVFLNTTVSGILAPLFRKHGYRVITLVHEMGQTLKDLFLVSRANDLVNDSDRIIFPSSVVEKSWRKIGVHIPAEKVQIMPQGNYHTAQEDPVTGDLPKLRSAIRKEFDFPEESKLVLACGMLEPRKAPDVFLETAKKIHEKDRGICFLWIAQTLDLPYVETLKPLMEETKDFCRIIGFRDNIHDYYAAADLFFLSSKEDPFPTAGILALGHTLPVVMHKASSGISDLCGTLANGCTEIYSAENFAEEIQTILSSEQRYRQLQEAVRNIYRAYHSFDEYAAKLLDITQVGIPKISCVIPNYNYADYLPERIQSVTSQTFPIYELILLDDHSTDNSHEVITQMLPELKKRFSGRIKYIRNEKNAGVFKQWQRGFQEASGDLVWIAEADDLCHPNMIGILAHAFIRMPSLGLAWSNSVKIDENGTETAVFDDYYKDLELDYTRPAFRSGYLEITKSLAVKNIIINTSAVLMKRQYLLDIPEELLNHKLVGDWLVYVHLLKQSNVFYYPERLNYHREHTRAITHQMNFEKLYDYFDENLTAQEYVKDHFPLTEKILNQAAAYSELLIRVRENVMADFPADKLKLIRTRIAALRKQKEKQKPRICFFSTNDYGWGGSEISILRFAMALAEKQIYEILLCVPDVGIRHALMNQAAKNNHLHFCGRVSRFYYSDETYYHAVKDFAPVFIYSSQGALREAEIFMNWCAGENIPFTNMVPLFGQNQIDDLEKDQIKQRLCGSLKNSSFIFSDNLSAGRFLKEMMGKSMPGFAALPNCLDVPYSQPETWPSDTGEYRLMYMGRIVQYHKGLDLLLEVMSRKKWQKRPLHIYLYGKGDYESVLQKRSQNNHANLHLMGFTSNHFDVIRNMHGAIFASRMEGTPITLVCFMLCHRMVVGTPVGGLPDLIVDGQTGFLADEVSADALDAALERAWEMRDQWKELGLNAGKYIREKIPADPSAEYIPYFNKIIEAQKNA